MKKTKKKAKKTIVVDIAQFGNETQTVRIPEGSTIEDALDAAGVSVPRGAQLYVDGKDADHDDVVEDDDIISIVTPKQAGA